MKKPMGKVNAGTGNVCRHRFVQIIYLTLVVLLLCAAGFFRFRLPQEPFIDFDVPGYLHPALLALTHNDFQHVEGRSFVYPGFVYLILGIFHDFRAISIIQHFFGLAAGGLLLVCWNCSLIFIRNSVVPNLIYRLVGLIVAALFLFNGSVLRFEYLIRPEAIFPFFAVLSIFFNIQFVRYQYLEKERQRALIFGTLTLFNVILLFFLKPHFYLATAFASLPVWISLLDPKEPINWKLQLTGISGISIVILLLLPEHFLKKNDPDSKTFLPTTLFLIHANIIRDQLKRDIEHKTKTKYPPEFLEKTYSLLDHEMTLSKQTGHYHSLGFDPDYLMYRDSFDRKFSIEFDSDPIESSIKFYDYYYFRVWMYQPGRMLKKILVQLSILYNNIGKASPYKLEDHTGFGTSYTNNCNLCKTKLSLPQIQCQLLTAFEENSARLTETRAHLSQPSVVSWINGFLARTFTLSIVLAIVLAIMIAKNFMLRTNYRWFIGIILLLYTYSFSNSLGIAIIHSLEITRYLTSQLGYCLLPQCMTLFLAVEMILQQRVHKKGATF